MHTDKILDLFILLSKHHIFHAKTNNGNPLIHAFIRTVKQRLVVEKYNAVIKVIIANSTLSLSLSLSLSRRFLWFVHSWGWFDYCPLDPLLLIDWLIDDHLYSAILRSLEQTHCARLWFYMSDKLFIARFLNIHRSGVLKRWHGWCHMKLQPSRRKFCVHHTTMHHVTSCKATYVRCMQV